MESEVDENHLVACARQGDLDAFETLVQRHSAMAYRVAMRFVDDHHDAQDVAQEALMSAWQTLPDFRTDSSFSTWLYTIVTRKALNKRTRGPRETIVELSDTVPDHGHGPAESASRNQSADAVAAAVADLPPAQRVAIVLHHYEGLSYADIASITATSIPAVRSHLFRARRTLAATLRQWR
ncbi:MAG: polymerase sigma70 factor [Pseudonocardiales bacterium]|nr:polymerase sigma70 factor [Pseudonocardiales bacterium]